MTGKKRIEVTSSTQRETEVVAEKESARERRHKYDAKVTQSANDVEDILWVEASKYHKKMAQKNFKRKTLSLRAKSEAKISLQSALKSFRSLLKEKYFPAAWDVSADE